MPKASSSRSVYQKIVAAHLEDGEIVPGRTIALKVDQTSTHGPAGTLACLEFEAMGLDRVTTDLAACYAGSSVDAPDEQAYLETAASRYGMHFSRPGNGPPHIVHLERFSAPGKTLAGTHARIVACGGAGMLALPATGLEVAVAMGGGSLHLRCPEVVQVFLRGKLRPLVSPRDVALELLRRRTRKGGAGKIFEFGGPGTKTLPVDERATIAVLCAELGAVTAIFPSDERTRSFLQAQRRIKAYRRVEADADATYDDREEIDLAGVEPMIAGPAPLGVRPVRDATGHAVRGAVVGDGGQATVRDLLALAAVLKGRRVQSSSPLVVSPGSRQVRGWATSEEVFAALEVTGARLVDTVDASDASGGVVLRVALDDGTPRACLASAETAGASAVNGEITDPRSLKRVPKFTPPRRVPIDDSLLVRASKEGSKVEIRRGPHVAPLPPLAPMPPDLSGRVLLKVGDDVGHEAILPPEDDLAGRQANLALLAEMVFSPLDPEFARRARDWSGGCVVAGQQFGLGERREFSALAPRLLGVRVVLARSFARPHLQHLVHFGILPLTFLTGRDYEAMSAGDDLHVPEAAARLKVGRPVIVENRSNGRQIEVRYDLSDREREILVDGGLLAFTRRRARKGKEAVAA